MENKWHIKQGDNHVLPSLLRVQRRGKKEKLPQFVFILWGWVASRFIMEKQKV